MSDNSALVSFEKKRKFMIVLGFIVAFMVGLGYTWSVVQTPIVQAMGGVGKTATVALVYTFNVLCGTMTPSLLGGFTKRLKINQIIILGGLFFGVGYFMSGHIHTIPMLFIFYGVCTGLGIGLIYPSLIGYTATIYPDKTGLMSGLMAGIYGGAAVIWCPILANLIEYHDLTYTFNIIGVLCLVAIIGTGLLIKPAPENFIEYKCGASSNGEKKDVKAPVAAKSLRRGEMVRTAMFYVAAAAFALGLTSGMMVISQSSQILQGGYGMTPTKAAMYASLLAFMSMAGRIVWGAVTDRTDKYITLCIICALPVLAMGVLSTRPTTMVAVACMSVTALCYGGFGGTITPITSDLFGPKYITENYGVMFLMFGIAGLIGPRVAVMLNNNGDYSKAFMVGCVFAVVSLAAAFMVRRKVKVGQAAIKEEVALS